MTTHEAVDLLRKNPGTNRLWSEVILGTDCLIDLASSYDEGVSNSLTWLRDLGSRSDIYTPAVMVILPFFTPKEICLKKHQHTTIVRSTNPRLEYALLANQIFPEKPVDDLSTRKTYPWVTDGFGWVRDEDGTLVKFPHYGDVYIHSSAIIAESAKVARAPLGTTIISEGVRIDNMVHIAHGVEIGKHTSIAALSCIEGSVKIGAYCTIGSGVIFQIGSGCGDRVTIGSGSVVTKKIPDGETWIGVPARKLR
ncbi:MAG: hypothetical protein J3T61_09770 [Candidatus Brocadiales bacterium]|nr:hypothetical protein [Candidatus Bathyanammoxibius sp.]